MLTLVPRLASQTEVSPQPDVIATLEHMLARAKSNDPGCLNGIAFAALYADGSYVVDHVGTATKHLVYTHGLVALLSRRLCDKILSHNRG